MSEARATQAQEARTDVGAQRVFADILCAVDGTHRSYEAVRQAAALAGPGGALTLLAVTAEEGEGQYQRAAISPQRAERLLERAAGLAQHARVPCTTTVDPGGPPAQVVLDRAAAHDLLALGAPESSLLGGLLIDGVAHSAARSPTAPLLAARELPEQAERFGARIVVASDGLDGSDELVALAGRLAHEQGAEVTLLHAVGAESRARPHRISEQARKLDATLQAASTVCVQAGDAAEAILASAGDAAASLIVMGSRGRRGLKAIGSVSRRVLHDAHCSVLLVPPERLHAC
jgi:nucleotide-binding universal stress UspA family protein